MWIEIFGSIASVLAVVGVVLNNRKMIKCFYLWIVSNFIFCLIHWDGGLWSLVVRDGIFIGLALEGIYRWGGDRTTKKAKIAKGKCGRDARDTR